MKLKEPTKRQRLYVCVCVKYVNFGMQYCNWVLLGEQLKNLFILRETLFNKSKCPFSCTFVFHSLLHHFLSFFPFYNLRRNDRRHVSDKTISHAKNMFEKCPKMFEKCSNMTIDLLKWFLLLPKNFECNIFF